MWEHYLHLITEPSRRKKERDLERKKEREELEKEYGKPIRLYPEIGPGIGKCYTPEFKGDKFGWGLSHLYPYSDFPDFSGDSIVELED
jgi:hypothetical protein